jgi:hypothetical protein
MFKPVEFAPMQRVHPKGERFPFWMKAILVGVLINAVLAYMLIRALDPLNFPQHVAEAPVHAPAVVDFQMIDFDTAMADFFNKSPRRAPPRRGITHVPNAGPLGQP